MVIFFFLTLAFFMGASMGLTIGLTINLIPQMPIPPNAGWLPNARVEDA